MLLQEKIAVQIPDWQNRVKTLVKEYGNVKVGEVTISQVFGGMRDVKSLVTDISYVDPVEGIRFRGFTIPQLLEILPKAPNSLMPLVGGLYYLLIVGEVPTYSQAMEVEKEWKSRAIIPRHVFDVIKAMPTDTNPMVLFSQAILALEGDSKFTKRVQSGIRKEEFWEPTLEDSLDLIAKLPEIAAFIYGQNFRGGIIIPPDPDLDWAANFAHMMGVQDETFKELCRLYFVLHSDHESGNVSAHAMHLVGSALSDVYYSASASMNGLAGPLHGRANQETLRWLLDVFEECKCADDREKLRKYAWDTLKAGQVIPGYGHAVLRKTDPRFTAFLDFGTKYMSDDNIFRLAKLVYEVVPDILVEQGKAKDPWPNVDAMSGAVLYHYGINDTNDKGAGGFYTVMFGVSRLLGVTANMVWARALQQPIERPKSLTTPMLEEICNISRPSKM